MPKLADYLVPIGKAKVVRAGTDVTIVAWSMGMTYALKAAEELAKDNINAEVIDLRTLKPMDIDTIVESVKKTGRLVTVEEGWRQSGVGAEIAARVMEQAFDWLDAPVAARHRQGRADALCGQSRKARAALGRGSGRGGEGRLLPMIDNPDNPAAAVRRAGHSADRARAGRRRGPARRHRRWRLARVAAPRLRRSGGLGHAASPTSRATSRASTRLRPTMSEDEVLERVRTIFEAEMDAPSDPGTTNAVS